jgi:hypothetical protein
VSLDEARVATVSGDGKTVSVGRLVEGAGLRPVLSGGDFAQPSWDPLGNLWAVDRSTGAHVVLPDGADTATGVGVPRLPGGRPTGLAVSRDGARIALTTGSGRDARMVVATVTGVDVLGEGESTVSLVAPREVLPDMRGVRGVAWSSAETLAVLGSRGGLALRPLDTSIDGYQVREFEPLSELVTLASAPVEQQGSPLVVGTADGRLELYTAGRGWLNLGPGSDPAYPG